MVQWLTRRTTDREVTGSNPVRHKHTEFGRERLTILLQIPPAPRNDILLQIPPASINDILLQIPPAPRNDILSQIPPAPRNDILLQIPPAPSFFSKKIPLYEPRFGIVPRQVMLSVAYPILIDVRFHNNLLLVYMYSCLYLV